MSLFFAEIVKVCVTQVFIRSYRGARDLLHLRHLGEISAFLTQPQRLLAVLRVEHAAGVRQEHAAQLFPERRR
jgi:hypothetical protein